MGSRGPGAAARACEGAREPSGRERMAEPNSDSGSGGVFCSRVAAAPEGGGCARGGFPSPRWHCAGGAALLLQRADRALCHSRGAAPVQLSLPDSLIINLFINCSAENRLARRASPWHRSAGVGRLARWGSTAKNTPVASEASSSPVIIYEQGSARACRPRCPPASSPRPPLPPPLPPPPPRVCFFPSPSSSFCSSAHISAEASAFAALFFPSLKENPSRSRTGEVAPEPRRLI